jgi:methionine biosynthesis protein MetW
MSNPKNFYEDYWQKREKNNLLHVQKGVSIPPRIRIAFNMISGTNRVLNCIDIGCGEGTLGKLLKAKFGKSIFLVGCDISNTALKYASRYYDEILQVDLESDDLLNRFRDRKFDYIISLETLEHLFRPEKLVHNFHKLLAESGEIIVSFPNIAWYKYRIQLLKGKFPEHYLLCPGEHIQYFTLHSFRELLQKTGFNIFEMDGQFFFPKLFRSVKLFTPLLRKLPNLFGYQIVIKAKRKSSKDNELCDQEHSYDGMH